MLFPSEKWEAEYFIFKEPVFWFPAELRKTDDGQIYFIGSEKFTLMRGKYLCALSDIKDWWSEWHLFDSTGQQELNHFLRPIVRKTKQPRTPKDKEEAPEKRAEMKMKKQKQRQ